MVKTCCVVGCKNRWISGGCVSFYVIPSIITKQGIKTQELSIKRRNAWIARLNRKDWTPNDNSRVCSVHFVSGKL